MRSRDKGHFSYKHGFFFVLPVFIILIIGLTICPIVIAEESGQDLFISHCAGCHVNGGNIIRRGKTLRLSALKRNGVDSQEEIAKIAREGIGIMSGYKNVLGEGGDKQVAIWIFEQAQNAWVHS